MAVCPLCGQKRPADGKCPVCGYAPEKTLHGDVRDERREDPLKSSSVSAEALERRHKITLNTIAGLDASSASREEVASTLSAAIQQLSIPAHIPFDKSLHLTETETRLVKALTSKLNEVDSFSGTVTADADDYVRLANAEYAGGDSASALVHLDKAILKEPKGAEAHFSKARILFNERRYAQALKILSKAVQLAPADEEMTAFKALVEQMAGTQKQ